MAAGSAAERAEAKGRASARKRGREVWLACLSPGLLSFLLPLSLPSQFVTCVCSHTCWPLPHLCLLLLHIHWTMLSHSYQHGVAFTTTHELPGL